MIYGLTKECKCAVGLYLLGSVKVEEAQEGGTPTDAADEQVLSRPADGGLYVYSVCVYIVYMYVHCTASCVVLLCLSVVLCCLALSF